MGIWKKKPRRTAVLALYGILLGLSACAGLKESNSLSNNKLEQRTVPTSEPSPTSSSSSNVPAQDTDLQASVEEPPAPEPGSEGDTLTIEDARMAYLVYKLLDDQDRIKGANLERGATLFYQNCRPCHGEDGRRLNFTPYERMATYIGGRAREDIRTFWHQMNFGDDVRGMSPYIDEIPLEDMVDIAGYAQTLP